MTKSLPENDLPRRLAAVAHHVHRCRSPFCFCIIISSHSCICKYAEKIYNQCEEQRHYYV